VKKILHVAVENYAGVPYDFARMHNECGDYSRLITQYPNIRGFKEDITLNFYVSRSSLASFWRKKKRDDTYTTTHNQAPIFKPKNFFEHIYFSLSDIVRQYSVAELLEKEHLNDFDIIHFDGGMDFTRKPKQALVWKKEGKKIVTCYYGSDLRSRGIIKELEEISDMRITSEYDHLELMDNLHYIFYPYDTSELPTPIPNAGNTIKIVHSPTNRQFKGTDGIISCIDRLRKSFPIDFYLLENMPRQEVLEIKKHCDICIDQVGGTQGGTGYGKSGLETLAMEIPTITNMTDEYSEWIPENPFVIANSHKELEEKLVFLIENKDNRKKIGLHGKKWVQTYHSYQSVNHSLYNLYAKHCII